MAGKSNVGNPKNKQYFHSADNPIEIIKDFGVGVVKTAQKDLISGVGKSAWQQIGLTPKIEGTLNPNEDLNLKDLSPSQDKEKSSQGNVMWFGEKHSPRPPEQNVTTIRDAETQQKIEQILHELKLLAKSVEKVNKEAAKIAVEQLPVRRGVYHANFFEWILKMIKMARAKVDESNLWLQQFQSKKSKQNYWAMSKKHGTSFTMSNERSLATQTG